MLERVSYYWKRSKSDTCWKVFFKDGSKEKSAFCEVDMPDGFWAADPFLFENEGKLCLFFEMFDKKRSIGFIACSEYENGSFSKPKPVIEDSFHFSFPCIFKIGNDIYMIPETGAIKEIRLYKCTDFPYKWEYFKTLISDIKSSDTIVYDSGNVWYLLASVVDRRATLASNMLYRINTDTMEAEFCQKVSDFGEYGIRNAGNLFVSENGQLCRPGQNGKDGQYGKSLVFWEPDISSEGQYSEKYLKEVSVGDFGIPDSFSGIHTYNKVRDFEVVDAKYEEYNSFFKRLKIMKNEIILYLENRSAVTQNK